MFICLKYFFFLILICKETAVIISAVSLFFGENDKNCSDFAIDYIKEIMYNKIDEKKTL